MAKHAEIDITFFEADGPSDLPRDLATLRYDSIKGCWALGKSNLDPRQVAFAGEVWAKAQRLLAELNGTPSLDP